VGKTAGAALSVVGHVLRGYSPGHVVNVMREQVAVCLCVCLCLSVSVCLCACVSVSLSLSVSVSGSGSGSVSVCVSSVMHVPPCCTHPTRLIPH
jgi:hypothetical protein